MIHSITKIRNFFHQVLALWNGQTYEGHIRYCTVLRTKYYKNTSRMMIIALLVPALINHGLFLDVP